MALNKLVVDVPISFVAQQLPDHGGPLGVLKSARQVVVEHYQPGQLLKGRIQPRFGFSAMSRAVRSAADGTVIASPDWSNPNLLADFNGELLSVTNAIPRVYAGNSPDSWTDYGDDRVVTHRLSARNLYASNHTIQVPDSAVLNGVRCSVHTETTGGGSPIYQLWVGFKSSDGGWVRPPFHFEPTDDDPDERAFAKVLTDGTYFWVFSPRLDTGDPVLTVSVFNTYGEELKTVNAVRNDTDHNPGVFDITLGTAGSVTYKIITDGAEYLGSGDWHFPVGAFLSTAVGGHVTITGDPNFDDATYTIDSVSDSTHVHMTPEPSVASVPLPGAQACDAGDIITATYDVPVRVLLAQYDPGTSGIDYSTFTFNGTDTITEVRVNDPDSKCSGKLGWLTNKVDNLVYLATILEGEGAQALAYQATGAGHTLEYGLGYSFNYPEFVDSLSGYTESNADPTKPPTVDVLVAHLARDQEPVSNVGPKFDPALRYTNLIQCDYTSARTVTKFMQSAVPVTRAFQVDETWYSWFYYQSGTGLSVDTSGITVSIDPADYFVGQPTQKIAVALGDYTEGSPISISTARLDIGGGLFQSVFCSYAGTSHAIGGADTVAYINSGQGGEPDLSQFGIPVGAEVLKWIFATGLPGVGANQGGQLVLTSSSIPTANNTPWDVLYIEGFGTKYVLTMPSNVNGQRVVPGTFSASGSPTYILNGFTGYRLDVGFTPDHVDASTVSFFTQAHIVVSGNPTSGNNGTFTAERCVITGSVHTIGSNPLGSFNTGPTLWVATTTQSADFDAFAAVIKPVDPNVRWSFVNFDFLPSHVGASLLVSGDTVHPTNNNEFLISAAAGTVCDTITATGVIAERFTNPFLTVSVATAQDVPTMAFHLANVDFDSTFRGASIVVQTADNDVNNGVYIIDSIDPSDDHIVYVHATTGAANQVNDTLQSATITIYKTLSFIDPFQSVWLMRPLKEGTKAIAGACESGRAYADWRVEADSTFGPTMFPCCIGSVPEVDGGHEWVLPYRGESVTNNLPVVTPRGQVAGVVPHIADAVGLKAFRLDSEFGQSASTQATHLLPGTLGGEFTSSGFSENNVVVAPEAPFWIENTTADAGIAALTANQLYQYIVVYEYTDESGQRTFSIPSPALNVGLSAGNNTIQIGGRLPMPLDTDGALVNATTGTTNRLVAINIYRTCIVGTAPNLTPTTIHYKITNDLNVNGLAPVTSGNLSGFSFPDSFTWTYLDQNSDAAVLGSEELYTDKGFLPRYPVPPFKAIVGSWLNRTWVVGYDNAVWFSFEHTEGDSVAFHPEFRFQLPEEDALVTLAAMEGYLVIFTNRSIWYLPASNNLPDAAGNGIIPNPVRTPFNNGCTGWAITLRDGVAYSTTADPGGVWLVTRAFENQWLSQAVQDSLTGEVLGLHVDGRQRLHVPTADSWFVFDQITGYWYEWFLPFSTPVLATVHNGEAHLQTYFDGVARYTPGQYFDIDREGVKFGIGPDFEFQTFDFSNVRGFKRLWEMQLVGKYKGPHTVHADISYPDTTHDTTTRSKTPDASLPWIIPVNPKVQQTPSFGLRIYTTFDDIPDPNAPGASFEMELVSAEVGIDSKPGLFKMNNKYRAT